MDYLKLKNVGVESSRLVYGCMRLHGDGTESYRQRALQVLRRAVEEGYTHFDHADIYGGGKSEEIFAEFLAEDPGVRDRIIITGKCGIIKEGNPGPDDPTRYDYTKEHILKSVEGSLRRMNIGHLDILLLHRPDYLMRAEEVAETFQTLMESGKVRAFGVSNFKPSQVSLLQKHCPMPLIINQVEINIHTISALEDGTLDQCQELGIVPQAWCPLAGVVYPAWTNTFTEEDELRIKDEVDFQARKYKTEHWIIALAWLLKHPANILPVLGTTRAERVHAAKDALDIPYTREDWYRLLEARKGYPVP